MIDLPTFIVNYKAGSFDLRFGNQQIAWGQAIFFRTFDVANGLDLRRHLNTFFFDPNRDIGHVMTHRAPRSPWSWRNRVYRQIAMLLALPAICWLVDGTMRCWCASAHN